jgi:hypothetical protein
VGSEMFIIDSATPLNVNISNFHYIIEISVKFQLRVFGAL